MQHSHEERIVALEQNIAELQKANYSIAEDVTLIKITTEALNIHIGQIRRDVRDIKVDVGRDVRDIKNDLGEVKNHLSSLETRFDKVEQIMLAIAAHLNLNI